MRARLPAARLASAAALALAAALAGAATPGPPPPAIARPAAAAPAASDAPGAADPAGGTDGAGESPGRADATAPYEVTVWARGRFGPDGLLQQLDFIAPQPHPPAFLAQLREALQPVRVRAPDTGDAAAAGGQVDGGLRIRVRILPGRAAAFQLRSVEAHPLPLEVVWPPRARVARARAGRIGYLVEAQCVVDTAGRCGEVRLQAADAVPEELRRAVRDAFRQWRFEPLRVDGRPVAAPAWAHFRVSA
ncbi:energy transducer TonB [Piscinibacter sakaiensis]|uniref:TonB C-terminal domain-containing protein n=1 Tax=Piscinibacter sakaiensis TaxID=1547922 RepID=A0A0K8P687_PISS1|nr:energy transducer TonB [Piscinibacter sakaiensis]GAP37720.1 hypothetical protein ISF6_3665 [Piscinibacter sakaiensis]